MTGVHCSEDKDVIYYVTAYNENMPMPEKPEAGPNRVVTHDVSVVLSARFGAREWMKASSRACTSFQMPSPPNTRRPRACGVASRGIARHGRLGGF